jgi:ribose transport system permease protein
MGQPSKFKSTLTNVRKNKNMNILIVFIFMLIIASVFSPYFMTVYNIQSIIREAAFIGLITLGQACLLLMGEIDLSVGSVAALSGVISGILMVRTPLNPFLVLVVCLLLGAFLGFVNGAIVTGLRLNALVVTIGMTGVYTGLNLVITKGQAVLNIPEVIYVLGQGKLFGVIPMPTVIMSIMAVIIIFIVKYTQIGRYMYAIGNSRETATIIGLPVQAVRIFVFSLTGMLSAMAGLLMVARIGTAQPSIGATWPLNSIAAAVIGGVSLTGGIGNPLGALIGVGIIVIIQNMIVLFGVSPYLQTAVSGVVVVMAISFDSISNMLEARRIRRSKINL